MVSALATPITISIPIPLLIKTSLKLASLRLQIQIYFILMIFRSALGDENDAWCAFITNDQQYIQLDFTRRTRVTRIVTYGRSQKKHWVKRYLIQFSNDEVAWYNYKENGFVKVSIPYYRKLTLHEIYANLENSRYFFVSVNFRDMESEGSWRYHLSLNKVDCLLCSQGWRKGN